MSGYFNNLSQQLFNKPLHSCSVEEVQNMAEQYPYFAPAQFLLLKKLEGDHEGYGRQFQRSILYYKNPLEFDYFIQNEHYITEFDVAKKEEVKPEVIDEKEEEFITVTDDFPNESVAIEEDLDKYKEDIAEDISVDKEEIIAEGVLVEKELEEVKEPATEQTSEIAFEPFHTVDYFASQGIKLSQAEATNDRLGKQLKSFTEWLKTMKRVQPVDNMQKTTGDGVEKVVNMAEHSVKNPEVVTEAMAEVWVKQGNMEKAAEVYNKLSLLNPSKRAYFAAKIDHLKKEN